MRDEGPRLENQMAQQDVDAQSNDDPNHRQRQDDVTLHPGSVALGVVSYQWRPARQGEPEHEDKQREKENRSLAAKIIIGSPSI